MTVGGRVLGEVISAIGTCHRGDSREVPCQARTSRSQTTGQTGREVPLPPYSNPSLPSVSKQLLNIYDVPGAVGERQRVLWTELCPPQIYMLKS